MRRLQTLCIAALGTIITAHLPRAGAQTRGLPATLPANAVPGNILTAQNITLSGTGTIYPISNGTISLTSATPGTLTLTSFQPRQVKAAYLGVAVVNADPTLRAQLQLPEGVGLAVTSLGKDGPSQHVLQEHDVLYKLGDQVLVNCQQFEVLVRMHKAGETVELTVIRQAQQIQARVTLTEKEMPELSYVLGVQSGQSQPFQFQMPETAHVNPPAPAQSIFPVAPGNPNAR